MFRYVLLALFDASCVTCSAFYCGCRVGVPLLCLAWTDLLALCIVTWSFWRVHVCEGLLDPRRVTPTDLHGLTQGNGEVPPQCTRGACHGGVAQRVHRPGQGQQVGR